MRYCGITVFAVDWGHDFVGAINGGVRLGLDVIRMNRSEVLIDVPVVVVVMVLGVDLLQFTVPRSV